LAALWVRTADRVALGPLDISITCLLMILPGWVLVTRALPAQEWTVALWYACATAGAVGVGFALHGQRRLGVQRALPFAIGAFAWGCGVFALQAMALHRTPLPDAILLPFLRQFLIYLPAVFVLEEVAFRGALDSHVAPLASENSRSWLSALFVAALWGLWHFPIVPPGAQTAGGVIGLLLVHMPMGVLLAYTWRKGGTLLLPAIVHSAVDAYRNIVTG
jgi:membrane protease YdiL (CAAX protease family)